MTDTPDNRRRILELPQKRLALLALELQDELARERSARTEPLAVVGMACRFPGGSDSPDAFWAMLQEGRDAIVEVPDDRWPIDDLYDPDPDAPGRIATRWGGYLDDVQRFDADFFSISPREARAMDPQQRLLMEVTWRAFEDAGIPPSHLFGRRAGVFVGLCNNDYLTRLLKEGTDAIDAYLSSGSAYSVASGRIAFTFGFQGPAVTYDTACSSSLVALHAACRSLREGESEMAVAAGVNVMCSPETAMALSRARMMAPDGRCKTFDDAADGFVRAEGCGVLLLKRLSDARRAGDRIHALLRGSALGQDGRSTGLTVPNGPAQEEVVRTALADAGLEPDDIDYVEAHGTGTSLGDPIEIRALGQVFGDQRERPLLVGSVKTNIGHLESAAGVAGVLKTILSLQEGYIPPHLHLKTPSTRIEWDEHDVRVAPEGRDWPATGRPRRAGVSSFGFSGTNAHVIVEEAPASADPTQPSEPDGLPFEILPVSGVSPGSRDEVAAAYVDALDGATPEVFRSFCHTARVGRTAFPWREAVVAPEAPDVGEAYRGVEDAPWVIRGESRSSEPPPLAFLFTGQGAQHPGMGRGLYHSVPAFRDGIDRCAEILDPLLPLGLRTALFEGEGMEAPIYRTSVAQPAVVAFEWSLARMWRAWGVRPAAVVGHSLGEFVAACVAGVLSLEDMLPLVAERGRLLDSLPRGDRMAAVFAPAETVEELLAGHLDEAAVAAYNGPENTVVSGPAEVVHGVVQACAERGIEHRELRLDRGFHSPRVRPILDQLQARAEGVQHRTPTLPMAWNVSGEVEASPPTPGTYWREHARRPVRFMQGVRALAELGMDHFLEVGPHPTLSPLVAPILEDRTPTVVPTLRRDADPAREACEAAARLWVEGVDVDLGALYPGPRPRMSIPGHPLRGERYWVDPPATARPAAPRGSLPGVRLASAVPIYETVFTPETPSFLDEHRFRGDALVPGPVLAALAVEAARLEGRPAAAVIDLELVSPAMVAEAGLRVQTVLEQTSAGLRFRVLSLPVDAAGGARWTEHARGKLTEEAPAAPPMSPDSEDARSVGDELHLERLRELGFDLGPAAARWSDLVAGGGQARARLRATQPGTPEPLARALLLDAAAQVLGAAVAEMDASQSRMLAGADALVWTGRATEAVRCSAVVHAAAPGGGATGNALLLDVHDRVVAWLQGVRLSPAPAVTMAGNDWHHRLEWREAPLPAGAGSALPDSATDEAADRVDAAWTELARAAGLSEYLGSLPGLRERVARYVAAALARLGLDGTVGSRLPQEPAEALGIDEAHRRLVPRLLRILAEEGYLARSSEDGYEVVRPFPEAPPEPASSEDPVMELVDRCGRVLDRVLTGEMDPLELLFPEGGRDTTRSIYRDTAFGQAFNDAIRESLRATSEPDQDRPLRILEVGAGSGSTTLAALEGLGDRNVRYVFTDVAPSLVASAEEELGRRDHMEFRVLDVEQSPATQGFTPGSQDLVIAANVVHATERLDRTLTHLRELLAPGGMLVLLEGTGPEAWVDVTFGLTQGWWRFADTEVRTHHPLLSTGDWTVALEGAGFRSVRSAPSADAAGEAGQVVLLARKPPHAALVALPERGELAGALENAGTATATDADVVFDGRGRSPEELVDAVRTVLTDEKSGRLWVLTADAQAAPSESDDEVGSPDPAQASLWGIARAFALEHPDRWGGIIDVAGGTPADEIAGRIRAEVASGDDEDQVAWRDGRRWVPRLVPAEVPEHGTDAVPEGTYLVTGGLGGLGLKVGEWLVDRGATRLVLVGRTASRASLDPEDPRHGALAALDGSEAEVLVRALDVTDREAVEDLFTELRESGPAIRGIVHAAAVFHSVPVEESSPEGLRAVLEPKSLGAEHLLAASSEDHLAFVVFFSSTTSILGVAGLGAYAAANQYLDALAARERRAGRPVVSIGWGIWDEMRQATREAQAEYVRVGLRPMESEAALDAMGRVIAAGVSHAVVVDADWDRLRSVYDLRRRRPILSELGGEVPETGTPSADPVRRPDTVLEELARLEHGDRLEAIADAMEGEVRSVLRLPATRFLDRERGFFEMGMDSLMSVELKSRLERRIGMRLPSTLAFNYPTISEASEFIAERVAAESTPEPEAETAAPGTPATTTSDAESTSPAGGLSEEEIGRRLSERLAQLEKSGGSP